MLEAWCKVNFLTPTTKKQISHQCIWYNSHIRIDGKPVMWKKWVDKGIILVHDLVTTSGNFKDSASLEVDWLQWCSLMNTIPQEWKNSIKCDEMEEKDDVTNLYDVIKESKNPTRIIYDRLMESKQNLNKYRERWEEKGIFLTADFYRQLFLNLKCAVRNPKLREFQYRLLLGKIVTNENLVEWGLATDSRCYFCKTEKETLIHLMYECHHEQKLVKYIYKTCENNHIDYNNSEVPFIMNCVHKNTIHVINLMTVFLKQFVYRKKVAQKEV